VAQLDLGNGYSIDMADVDRFVKALDDARQRLDDTLRTKGQQLRVAAPGRDDYSGAFAFTMNSLVRQHQEWNLARQKELQGLIDRVRAVRDSYLHVEQNNTPRV
jgi:hypothetical protein